MIMCLSLAVARFSVRFQNTLTSTIIGREVKKKNSSQSDTLLGQKLKNRLCFTMDRGIRVVWAVKRGIEAKSGRSEWSDVLLNTYVHFYNVFKFNVFNKISLRLTKINVKDFNTFKLKFSLITNPTAIDNSVQTSDFQTEQCNSRADHFIHTKAKFVV